MPLVTDEWYHCYTRGVEKRTVFESTADYKRFVQLLYLANDTKSMERSSLSKELLSEIYSVSRTQPLVNIGAYTLMHNHFHLLLQQNIEGGITSFMRKIGTGYTMYFNLKNKRVGNLFIKPFRSKHIEDDRYLQRVSQYIHLNAAEIFEPEWKQGNVSNIATLTEKMLNYEYSSFRDYNIETPRRPERSILSKASFELFGEPYLSPRELLVEAHEYYASLNL